MFENIVPQEVYATALVFCRVGALLYLMPTVGEAFIQARTRLAFAFVLTLLLAPVVSHSLPLPSKTIPLFLTIFNEVVIGLFLGLMMRLLFSALSIAGSIISFLSGFSSALVFNPALREQGSLFSVFLSLTGLVLLLATDMHHLMLRSLADSYAVLKPGLLPVVGDMAESIEKVVGISFQLAVELAAPLLVTNLGLYVLLGILARLIPQIQVFFVALPLQIILGMIVLSITLPALMLWFMEGFTHHLKTLLLIVPRAS